MLPLGVSAVTLGFGFLVTLDRPPLDLRSSPVLVPIAQAMVALPLVVRTLVPVLALDRPAAAAGRRVAGGLAVAGAALRRPAGARGGRCSPRPGSRSRCRSASSARPASWPGRTDPTLPVVIYQLVSRPGDQNFGMALAASVVLGLVTVAVMAAVERLRLGSVGAF